MLPYVTYKSVHFLGLAMVLVSLGALIAAQPGYLSKRILAITHGIGLLLLIVSGFGMLAKLGLHWPLPGWVSGKLLVWLFLGALMGLAPRLRARQALGLWIGLIAAATLASYLASSKPF